MNTGEVVFSIRENTSWKQSSITKVNKHSHSSRKAPQPLFEWRGAFFVHISVFFLRLLRQQLDRICLSDSFISFRIIDLEFEFHVLDLFDVILLKI